MAMINICIYSFTPTPLQSFSLLYVKITSNIHLNKKRTPNSLHGDFIEHRFGARGCLPP